MLVKTGDKLIVKGGDEQSTDGLLIIDYEQFATDIPIGSFMLIDDGELEFKITAKIENSLEVEVCNDGEIKVRKA